MAVAQPANDSLPPPFGAVVARQLSVWPFAARTQRLYLLVDPSLTDSTLRAGLLRAMQQAYFRSDSASQTRAMRDAAMAAHYVLRHRNRGLLPQHQVSAATAVAAVRGTQAYVPILRLEAHSRSEQEREVKRAKDRVTKRLLRERENHG